MFIPVMADTEAPKVLVELHIPTEMRPMEVGVTEATAQPITMPGVVAVVVAAITAAEEVPARWTTVPVIRVAVAVVHPI